MILELAFGHLAVRHRHARLGHHRADALGGLVDGVHPVVEEEGLACARQLALDRRGHQLLVVLADVCLHRPAALGRGLDHRDVAQAGERHLQCARDRRGREGEHVDPQLQLAQQLLLLDAEALLLVHDQQAQVLRPHVARQQPVRADQDVDLASLERRGGLARLLRRAKARHHVDRERVVAQALVEGAEVLLGEHGRGHQEHHLLAVLGRLERGPQGDLGLAVAHVAADQAVHRARLLHVGADGLDRLELVGGLAVGERALELHLPLRVVRERVPGAALALGVERDQLAGERLGRAPGTQLLLLPLLAAQLRQLRVAGVGAHVAADLVQLVARHEHAIAVAKLELQVVAGGAADRLGLEAREERHAVVLVHHGRAGTQVGERGEGASARALGLGAAAAAQQAVLGHDRQLQRRRQKALSQPGVGEQDRGLGGGGLAVEEGGLHAGQVQLGALRLAAAGPGDDRAIAGADQLLQLRLGLAQRARGGVGALSAELVWLVAGDARQPQRRAPVERLGQAVRMDVEVVGILVVEAGRHVLPEVAQRGRQLLLGRDGHERVLRHEVEQLEKTVDRQHVGDVGALVGLRGGGDLGKLAVLGPQLRRGGDLDPLGFLEGALGEGGEPGQALDLHVEQLAANGPLLGRGVDVEDVAAHGELAALLDLVHALVAARHQRRRDLVEVQQAALLDREAVWAQGRVGHLLGQRRGGGDHDRGLIAVHQGVQRGDAQPDQVGWRVQVGLVAHAAGGVEAHRARGEVGLEVRREVARRAIVSGHHERRAVGLGVEQRGEQVRAQAGRDEGPLRRGARGVGEGRDLRVLLGVLEQWSEHAQQPPGAAARPIG